METKPLVRYVGSSSVRADIVRQLTSAAAETGTVLDEIDASESAIYDALTDLERKNVVITIDDQWQLTGCGQIVADLLEREQRTQELIDSDPEYWANHDIGALPESFRHRLPEIGEYDVVRDTQTDFNRVVRVVANRVESADWCDVISPVYHESYKQAMPDNEDSRLLVHHHVVENVMEIRGIETMEPDYDVTSVRITSSPIGLARSDDWMILTLPRFEQSSIGAKIISETDSAVTWAADLFNSVWEAGVSFETYFSNR